MSKEALAKQEQGEPVAWAKDLSHELLGVIIDVEEGDGFDEVCLNTIKRVCSQLATTPQPAQKPWVRLTDEERKQIHDEWRHKACLRAWGYEEAIEAKLKEKNT